LNIRDVIFSLPSISYIRTETLEKMKCYHYVGYGLGDVGNALTFTMSTAFLLMFYTDVLGITAAMAGTLFLVARLWDGFNDPLMGHFADKRFQRREKKGDKFRSFLLKGSWPVALAALLMFSVPSRLEGGPLIIWAFATYTLWGMCYTFVNIPYGSLAAVMTREPMERSILSVSRGIGSLIGMVLPRVIVPLLLVHFGESRQEKGYLTAMGIISTITLLCYVISWLTTFENPQCRSVTVAEKRTPFASGLLKNRPFIALSLASIAMLTGIMINGTMNVYYFRENLNALEMMAYTGVAALLPAVIAALIIPRLVIRFGASRTSAWASLTSSLVWTILLFLPSHPWLYLGGSLVGYLFIMIPHMTVWAMVSDCIDYQELLTGERQEGVIYGIYSFVRKSGQAIAGFLAGTGLALFGYKAELNVQTAQTLVGIKFLTLAIPALCLFIAFLSYRFLWKIPGETS
jgi:glycoside/pentoside/hexuronide:cation symporter, GPH family